MASNDDILIAFNERYDSSMRKIQREMDRAAAIESIVPYLFQSGQISFEELEKYVLHPKGVYVPKLIKHP